MHQLSGTVAIATLSSHVLGTCDTTDLHAGAIGAIKVSSVGDEGLGFTLHTHCPQSPTRLRTWVDALVADDPLLIGYRLGRTSRLLGAAGYDRHLARSFSRHGRHEIVYLERARPVPLSIIAVLSGCMAVDEEALIASRPIPSDVAAALALTNAVTSWMIYMHRMYPGTPGFATRRHVLRDLSDTLVRGPVPAPLAATMTCRVQ